MKFRRADRLELYNDIEWDGKLHSVTRAPRIEGDMVFVTIERKPYKPADIQFYRDDYVKILN